MNRCDSFSTKIYFQKQAAEFSRKIIDISPQSEIPQKFTKLKETNFLTEQPIALGSVVIIK